MSAVLKQCPTKLLNSSNTKEKSNGSWTVRERTLSASVYYEKVFSVYKERARMEAKQTGEGPLQHIYDLICDGKHKQKPLSDVLF